MDAERIPFRASTLARAGYLTTRLCIDNGGAPSVGGFNYPFRGQKNTAFEGGLHNPAVIFGPKWLGRAGGHQRYNGLMHCADWAPTLLGLVDKGSVGRAGVAAAVMEGINGVDHSDVLMSLSKATPAAHGANATPYGPRDTPSGGALGLLLEFNIVFDHAAFLRDNWKLVLGSAGREELFGEPHGRWYDSQGRAQFVVEELLCDVIDFGLGPNWFPYGWVLRQMIDRVVAYLRGDRPPHHVIQLLQATPFGETIPVTDDRLPRADWGELDAGRIRLYNLTSDPFETTNVAASHRDVVNELTHALRSSIIQLGAKGHHASMQKQFLSFLKAFAAVVFGVVVTMAALVVCTVSFCCRRVRRSGRKGPHRGVAGKDKPE